MSAHLDQEPSREVRRVINAIHDLSELESQIPLCKTIDEVEEIRRRYQAIEFYHREHRETETIGSVIVAWANRCAVLCQLRITELQELARRKRNGESLPVSDSLSARNRRSEAHLVAALSPEELARHTQTSRSVQMIASKIRKTRKKKEPKGNPEKRAKDLERYYNNKAKKRAALSPASPPAKQRSPAQKFERYWPQEEKLLQQFFTESDLPAIEKYWVREFQSYCKEVEDGKRARQEALAKLKTTTAPEMDIGAGEGK